PPPPPTYSLPSLLAHLHHAHNLLRRPLLLRLLHHPPHLGPTRTPIPPPLHPHKTSTAHRQRHPFIPSPLPPHPTNRIYQPKVIPYYLPPGKQLTPRPHPLGPPPLPLRPLPPPLGLFQHRKHRLGLHLLAGRGVPAHSCLRSLLTRRAAPA